MSSVFRYLHCASDNRNSYSPQKLRRIMPLFAAAWISPLYPLCIPSFEKEGQKHLKFGSTDTKVLCVFFVSHFVSRTAEKGAKRGQRGLFWEIGRKRKSLKVHVFPLDYQILTMILSPVRLPFRHSGNLKFFAQRHVVSSSLQAFCEYLRSIFWKKNDSHLLAIS